MDILQSCSDLQARLEHELVKERVNVVNQSMSQIVLSRIARELGVKPSIAYVFTLPRVLSTKEYIAFVEDRLRQFQAIDRERALDEAENVLFASTATTSAPVEVDDYEEVPIETDFPTMMEQLKKWPQSAGLTQPPPRANAAPPLRKDSDTESSSDDSDSSSDDEEDKDQKRGDKPLGNNANTLCDSLLNDQVKIGKFTKDAFTLVNPANNLKVDVHQLQPFLDHLITLDFDPVHLKQVVSSLLQAEFRTIRELNYVHFSIFIRHLLQKYLNK